MLSHPAISMGMGTVSHLAGGTRGTGIDGYGFARSCIERFSCSFNAWLNRFLVSQKYILLHIFVCVCECVCRVSNIYKSNRDSNQMHCSIKKFWECYLCKNVTWISHCIEIDCREKISFLFFYTLEMVIIPIIPSSLVPYIWIHWRWLPFFCTFLAHRLWL